MFFKLLHLCVNKHYKRIHIFVERNSFENLEKNKIFRLIQKYEKTKNILGLMASID